MKANDTQVGGNHYRKDYVQHWDVVAALRADYFQGQITKYVCRWRDKNGLEDLHKARHFMIKYIEVVNGTENYYNPVNRIDAKQYEIGCDALLQLISDRSELETLIISEVFLWKTVVQLRYGLHTLEDLINGVEQEEGYPTSGYTNQG